jgi:3-oxoacyl-[acyl-carrier protein] reductase/meso-butanediol dehydrogenase/(S,S)-butanediol dehydrogenase/diacetyl reductase
MTREAQEPRTVVVTGGTRGLGADITRAFHGAGDRVLVAARRRSELVDELGERVRFEACDVRRPADLRAAVDAAVEWTGHLEVLVNNAGYSKWKPLAEVEEFFWDDMLETNLKGVFFASQAAAVHLGKGGVIVNVSSLAGKRGSANNSVYCASKFGVNGVTQALAKELGPRGIRVNAVCPVYIQTEGLLEALSDTVSPARGDDTATYLSGFAASQTALGALPTGDQVAQSCLFLASAAAGAITGQCINVDCGVLPQ